jgi:carboxylesterase
MADILPGAEPIFVRGGPTALLMLHGFTASPSEMRPLAAALAADNLTLLAPLLPGHGTRPVDLNRIGWQDWHAAALEGYCRLRDQCERVFVTGLSMGGALALLLAAEQPVAGVIALSAPSLPYYQARGWAQRSAGWLGYVMPYLKKPLSGPPDREHPVPRTAYPVRPVRAVAQFFALVRAAAVTLPQVTAPALLVHSRADTLIPPPSADYIAAHLGSADKQLLWLDHSDHVVTEDPARPQVFAAVRAFLGRHA